MTTHAIEPTVTASHQAKLGALLAHLIDQKAARVVVEPYRRESGFWFGGGNIVRDAQGTLWLVGRYRNYGDSRTGVGAGDRGLELALFASTDQGRSFEKMRSWSKADLSSTEGKVVSIEGASLHAAKDGSWELFVSSEKDVPYPPGFEAFQKPGTGVWSIDVLHGASPQTLDAATIRPVLDSMPDPAYLHVKDPVVFDRRSETVLVFCNHPYSWSSANSGYAVRPNGASTFDAKSWEMLPRGPVWDVAGTRITNRLRIPRVGAFADLDVSVYFYDGLECYRSHEESAQAVKRPRGYSCEEIGGACYGLDDDFPNLTRLSRLQPLFISPYGSGCSRYVNTLADDRGILAVWQQSQSDRSQPLVAHFLPMDEVERLLRANH